jgi:uncharacterized protein YjbJ (UPF0337 family)
MNWDIAKGRWKQHEGKLVGKIQEVCGISKEEAERQIQGFESRSIK